MDAHDKARDAIVAELERQADGQGGLNVEQIDDGLAVDGQVDVDALAAAVVGAIAGGP